RSENEMPRALRLAAAANVLLAISKSPIGSKMGDGTDGGSCGGLFSVSSPAAFDARRLCCGKWIFRLMNCAACRIGRMNVKPPRFRRAATRLRRYGVWLLQPPRPRRCFSLTEREQSAGRKWRLNCGGAGAIFGGGVFCSAALEI